MVKIIVPIRKVEFVEQGEKVVGYQAGNIGRIEEPGGLPSVFTNPLSAYLLSILPTPGDINGYVFIFESDGPFFNDANDEPVGAQEL